MCAMSVWACGTPEVEDAGIGGSTTDNGSGDAPDMSSGSSGDTGGGTGSGSGSGATGGGATTGGGPTTCADLATWESCEICECNKNEAGCDQYWTLEDEHCYCGGAAPCLQACGVYCNNEEDDLDPACAACDDGLDGTCYDAAEAMCASDEDCSAYVNTMAMNCDNLPDP
jgi:hypothetical protein